MSTQPDFFLYDRIGRLTFRGAPFFLLVTPGRLYIWKDALTDLNDESPPVPPDYEVDGGLLFCRYLERSRWKLEEIHRPTFELIVMSWLSDLIWQRPDVIGIPALESSGLSEAA
ncbi:MAG TPA: hypothetical protein VGM86_21025, partial [Thermoanaerobaculia bacterium]